MSSGLALLPPAADDDPIGSKASRGSEEEILVLTCRGGVKGLHFLKLNRTDWLHGGTAATVYTYTTDYWDSGGFGGF